MPQMYARRESGKLTAPKNEGIRKGVRVRACRDEWCPHDPTDCALCGGVTHALTPSTTQSGSSLFDDRVTRNRSRRADPKGLLKADARNDRLAVMNALHAHLEESLGTST